VKDPQGCCDICVTAGECDDVVCDVPVCEAPATLYTVRGQCCPICKPACDASACMPIVCKSSTSVKMVVDGDCCASCVSLCSEYSCPIAEKRVNSVDDRETQVVSKVIAYSDNGTALAGRVFVQAGWKKSDAPRALIVIVHDYNGISSYETARAHMLVELGYVVFCVDVFGAEIQATGASRSFAQWVPLLLQWLGQPTAFAERVLLGVQAALALPGVDTNHVALFGYCFGGTGVLNVALDDATTKIASTLNIQAILSFHAGLTVRSTGTSKIALPMSVYSGAKDDAAASIVDLENEMANRSAPAYEITRYSGTHHAFTVFDQLDSTVTIAGSPLEANYSARADSRSFASALDYVRIAFGANVVKGTAQPDAIVSINTDPRDIKFTSSKDVVTYAQRWAAESAYLKQGAHIAKFEQALLKACRIDVTTFRQCFIAVRTAMDVARVGNGGRKTLRAGSSSESSSSAYIGQH